MENQDFQNAALTCAIIGGAFLALALTFKIVVWYKTYATCVTKEEYRSATLASVL